MQQKYSVLSKTFHSWEREREREGESVCVFKKETDRQADRERATQTERQTDRQTERELHILCLSDQEMAPTVS